MNSSKLNNVIYPKLVGETRHYPPAVKEWKDSVYTYNKNYLKNLPSKNILVNKMIKYYFNLSDCKHLARSKRMRSLISKSSANKILVSRPELKQTNDNITITIYTLDRERQIILRKIYHNIRKWENKRNIQSISHINVYNSFDNWRYKYNLNKHLTKIENNNILGKVLFTKNNVTSLAKAKQVKNKYQLLKSVIYLKNKNLFNVDKIHYLKTRLNSYTLRKKRKNLFFKSFTSIRKRKLVTKRRNIPYYGIKRLNEIKFLRYISKFKNKSIQTRKRIYYSYMIRILHLLGIKVLNFEMINSNNNIKQDIVYQYINANNLNIKGKILFFLHTKGEYLGKPEILSIDNVQNSLPYLDKVNIILSNFVNKIFSNNLIKSEKFSFVNYSKTNFKEFLLQENTQSLNHKKNSTSYNLNKTKLDFLKKEISLIKDYINVKINNFKFGKYLPALKILISKIYNRNIQLNIIKLKYLFLNSDIFTNAISMELKKKRSLLSVIGRSLKLVEIPSEFNEITNNVNSVLSLNVYKSLKVKNMFTSNKIQEKNIDKLDLVIKNLYPFSLINQASKKENNTLQDEYRNINYNSKLTKVINILKYKWVTGVRLEAAGRLTRRYTASKSIYKYKYKGSLKNTDFSRKLDFLKKSMPVVMFRNKAKTNSQYSFAKSKRRIGAFGIKGWISSY